MTEATATDHHSDHLRAASRKVARRMLPFLGLLYFVNYLDRTNIGFAGPNGMNDTLELTSTAFGFASGVFFIGYLLLEVPSNMALHRFGARRWIARIMVTWGIISACTMLVQGPLSFYAVRFLLGMAEAGFFPGMILYLSYWFPARERARAASVFDNGQRAGTALALPIVTALIAWLGWRGSFLVTGALGLIWLAVWLLFYRRPEEHPRVSEEELAYIREGGARTAAADEEADRAKVPYRQLFRYRTVIGMMIGFFCLNYVIYFFITWFPSYLVDARGFDLLKLGIFGVLPALVAIPGSFLGGMVSDGLVRRGRSVTFARKVPLVGGMLCASVIALAVVVPSAGMALALLSLCYACLTFAAAAVWALPGDVAPTPAHVASIGGIQNCASNLAGLLGATTTGALIAATGGSYVAALVLSGALSIVGAMAYLLIVGKVEPLPIPAEAEPAKKRQETKKTKKRRRR